MQDIILVGGVKGNNVFTTVMAVPAIETMPDDVVPQPQSKATDSRLGSTSSSISVKGKEFVTPLTVALKTVPMFACFVLNIPNTDNP